MINGLRCGTPRGSRPHLGFDLWALWLIWGRDGGFSLTLINTLWTFSVINQDRLLFLTLTKCCRRLGNQKHAVNTVQRRHDINKYSSQSFEKSSGILQNVLLHEVAHTPPVQETGLQLISSGLELGECAVLARRPPQLQRGQRSKSCSRSTLRLQGRTMCRQDKLVN